MEAAANLPAPLPRELAEPTRLPLGSLLLRDGFLTAEQLEQALTAKDAAGGGFAIPVRVRSASA